MLGSEIPSVYRKEAATVFGGMRGSKAGEEWGLVRRPPLRQISSRCPFCGFAVEVAPTGVVRAKIVCDKRVATLRPMPRRGCERRLGKCGASSAAFPQSTLLRFMGF